MRDAIYREIDAERDHQDMKWGGPSHDSSHSHEDWEEFIEEYARGMSGRTKTQRFRERMVKIAALAVAAIESEDRP